MSLPPAVTKALTGNPANRTVPRDKVQMQHPHTIAAPSSGGGPRPGVKKVIQFQNKAAYVKV